MESEDNINTAVTASLHCLSKDECRAATEFTTQTGKAGGQ
jgi:hypothetical protein